MLLPPDSSIQVFQKYSHKCDKDNQFSKKPDVGLSKSASISALVGLLSSLTR